MITFATFYVVYLLIEEYETQLDLRKPALERQRDACSSSKRIVAQNLTKLCRDDVHLLYHWPSRDAVLVVAAQLYCESRDFAAHGLHTTSVWLTPDWITKLVLLATALCAMAIVCCMVTSLQFLSRRKVRECEKKLV